MFTIEEYFFHYERDKCCCGTYRKSYFREYNSVFIWMDFVNCRTVMSVPVLELDGGSKFEEHNTYFFKNQILLSFKFQY